MAEMSGQEIYDNFHNGVGAEGLATGASILKKVAGRYEERAREIQQLVGEMESAWQGDAAGRAQRGAGPLLTEHEIASHHFSVSEDLTDRQSGSFSRAKNSVVPVPSAPAEVPPWGPLSTEWAPYLQRVQEHHDAARHNVDVMNGYSGASTYNSDNLPASYGAFADDHAGVALDDADTIDSEDFRDTEPNTDGDPGPGAGNEPGPRVSSHVDGPDSGGAGPATGLVGNAPPPAETTTPGGYSHPGTPLLPPDYGQPRPVGGGPVSGVGVVGLGGGYSPGPGEFGRPRGGGPTGGLVPRGGAGAEPHPARSTSTSGLVTSRGTGTSGVPVGTGRRRDEDDTDHKTPTYLEGGDPEDLFGTELLTAPAVIGDEDDD